jgi:ABC-type transport system involved in Fe-S cluster assembly fused permease/ATPase subunit
VSASLAPRSLKVMCVCVCVCVYRVYTSQGDLCACVCVCVCVYHWYWQKLLDKRKALYYKHKELTKELTMGRFAVKVIA